MPKPSFQAYSDGINRRIAEFNPVNRWLQMPDEYWLLTIQSVLLDRDRNIPCCPQPWHVNDVMATVMFHLREFDPEGQRDVLGHGQLDNAVLAQTLAGVYGLEGLAMFSDLRWFNDPGAQTMIPTSAGAKSASIPSIDSAHLEKIISMPPIEEATRSRSGPGPIACSAR